MGDFAALRENVCAGCPGTLWGEQSYCRVQERHIGHIVGCYEWDHHARLDAERTLNQASYLLQRMEADIKSYAWCKQQVAGLQEQLRRMDSACAGAPSASLVAKYGVEATLPPSTAPDPDDDEQYIRLRNRLTEMQERIDRVDRAAAVVTESRERAVLAGLLEGKRVADIAKVAGISKRWAHEVRARLIIKMVDALVN